MRLPKKYRIAFFTYLSANKLSRENGGEVLPLHIEDKNCNLKTIKQTNC